MAKFKFNIGCTCIRICSAVPLTHSIAVLVNYSTFLLSPPTAALCYMSAICDGFPRSGSAYFHELHVYVLYVPTCNPYPESGTAHVGTAYACERKLLGVPGTVGRESDQTVLV